MEKVIDVMYKLSSEIHGLLNGCGKIADGIYYSMGRLYEKETENYTELEKDKLGVLDCRYDSVDMEMKALIRDRIYAYIKQFYHDSERNDDFLLMLGFSINIYYVVGLYSTFGRFDVEQIKEYVDSEAVREYVELINNFLYAKLIAGIVNEIQKLKIDNVDVYNGIVRKITENREIVCIDELEKVVNPIHKNFVPDIYMLLRENIFLSEAEEYLNEMTMLYPQYKFGWVYRCLEKGIQFYESKGNNIEVYEYKDKVGAELFFHILGLKKLDKGKIKVVKGKLEIIRPAIFSLFGVGIPNIKTINRDEYFRNILNSNEEAMTSIEEIRERTESILGIHALVLIESNPIEYTVQLMNVVEEQRDALGKKNKELERLVEQRRKMVDHLAHSWGNECYPDIVKKVADELLREGNSSLASRLFKAYNSESTLLGEIVFLQSAMSDEPNKLQNIFKDSFFTSGRGDAEWKIISIIEETLEIVVFSLLNYKGDNFKRNICRRKLGKKHTLEKLAEDYAKRFESEIKELSFIEWFSSNIFPIKIEMDNTWKNINFGKTEYGKILVKNIFRELFTNVLFHGNDYCEIVLNSDENKMCVIVRNNVSESVKGESRGLSSMKEIVAKLNYDTCVSEDEGISHGFLSELLYETKLTFAKELMFIEEW